HAIFNLASGRVGTPTASTCDFRCDASIAARKKPDQARYTNRLTVSSLGLFFFYVFDTLSI
ncbi:MAG: hypothetical protein ABI551_02190, partial [Polyangiaceae bacterium]